MKRFARIVILLLCLAMVLGAAACKKEETNTDPAGNFKVYDGEQVEDMGGYTFEVVDFQQFRWNKDPTDHTPFSDAWVQAMDEVEGLYNCKLDVRYVGPSELFDAIQPEIAAAGKYADLVITTQWAYGYLIGANLMMDLNALEINWDQPWWNQNIRKISTIQGKTLAGNSSFIFDTSQTYMLYYNEAIWNELGLPDPYKLVQEGKWTQDKFAEFAAMALKDQDGSGELDSEDDRWGVATPDGDFARAMFMGMGGHYYTIDDSGKVRLACNNQHTFDIVEKMYKMGREDKSICKLTGSDWPRVVKVFTDGNALFLGNSPGVGELKNMEDDWGVMPMPKLNEEQEGYYGCVDHNSSVFGCTSTNKETHKLSVILNALGQHCQILETIYWPDYKETYWRHSIDSEIIANYVVRTGQYDLAILMQNVGNGTFSAPMSRVYSTAFGGASVDFASYMDAVEDTINANLDEYFGY